MPRVHWGEEVTELPYLERGERENMDHSQYEIRYYKTKMTDGWDDLVRMSHRFGLPLGSSM